MMHHTTANSRNICSIFSHYHTLQQREITQSVRILKPYRLHTYNQPARRCVLCAAGRQQVMAVATEAAFSKPPASGASTTMLCTSITASTVEGFLEEIAQAEKAGAQIVELRLDYIKELNPDTDVERLIKGSSLPVIVTLRPTWEGGLYEGPEPERLAILKFAAYLGASFVDVEYASAVYFFADQSCEVPITTKIILSNHNYKYTPDLESLNRLATKMHAAGADIVKIATTAQDIGDSMTVLKMIEEYEGPIIGIAMGEKGQLTRLLAPKYGSFLTFGALQSGKESAPGQTTLQELRNVYHLQNQSSKTKVFGIVGNPVSHSRSPVLHNAAMTDIGYDGVYVPFPVDDMDSFIENFNHPDFAGFSVTIPHKEAALKVSGAVDPVAQQIGAVNTLLRQPDGSLKGYNTDWEAAISAIERALDPPSATPQENLSPLSGRMVVVIGAGGGGRALAFGAAARGAKVIIANRNRERAEQLASELGVRASVVSLEEVAKGGVQGDVLANSTSVGMHPKEEETPLPKGVLGNFAVVFDAVYTPLETRLLREAKEEGCKTVSGLEMFVGQAAEQFRLFTQQEPPVELMEEVVLKSLK